MIKDSYNLLLTIKGGWLNWYKCWMGGESWHAIKKLFNPPFLILKVRHPAVTGIYCIVRDGRSGGSNDFKCTLKLEKNADSMKHSSTSS